MEAGAEMERRGGAEDEWEGGRGREEAGGRRQTGTGNFFCVATVERIHQEGGGRVWET